MAYGFGAKCAKFLLFGFNILVFIAGLAVLSTGIWLLVDDNSKHYFHFLENSNSENAFHASCVLFVIVGAVVTVISFCGCCGACKESKCLLMMYATVLGLILILLIATGITAAVFKNDIGNGLTKSMNHTIQNHYGMPGQQDVTDSWDASQHDLRCCGASGPSDWKTSQWRINSTTAVPDSCCILSHNNATKINDRRQCNKDATSGAKDSKYLHTEGCADILNDWIRANANILIGIAFGLAVLLVFGMICACHLGRNKNGNYQYV